MAVLGVELHVAVTVQKHQLHGQGEKEMVHLKACVVKNIENLNEVWFDIHGNDLERELLGPNTGYLSIIKTDVSESATIVQQD